MVVQKANVALRSPSVARTVPGLQCKRTCCRPAVAAEQRAGRHHQSDSALRPAAVNATPMHDVPPIVSHVLRSSGQPLDEATRADREHRFGHDFSHVRVHTGAAADESARAVNARAYTVGASSLAGHGLTVQRQPSKGVAAKSAPETPVRVEPTGASPFTKPLPQGGGASGAVIYDYPAAAQKAFPGKDINEKGVHFDITLPILIYPPAILKPPFVDLFVFFHGMRADYGENVHQRQGEENIGIWSHLKEAVAGTDRLGIAPQAPATWLVGKKPEHGNTQEWKPATAQWNEALANIGGFDGLIKRVLDRLTKDLGLTDPLKPGNIHVAGHSAGGLGIIAATSRAGGAKDLGDMVKDVTLQDAGYSYAWRPLMDWFLAGSPGKTVRVLISQDEGGNLKHPGATRTVLTDWFNVDKINGIINKKGKNDPLRDLTVELVRVPDPEKQEPRPGGFVLESELVVKNKKTGAIQGTMVAFFAPHGGHYETVTATMGAAAAADPQITADFLGKATHGTYRVISKEATVFQDQKLKKPAKHALLRSGNEVEVTELPLAPESPDETTRYFIAKVKTADGVEGWMRLANLAPKT